MLVTCLICFVFLFPVLQISMMPQEHNCISTSNPVTSMASQSWVAEMAADWLRESPELGAKELQEKLQEVYSVEVSYATYGVEDRKR